MREGWRETTLGEVAEQVKRPLTLMDDSIYQRVTIRLRGRGIVERDVVPGSKIKTKRQFVINRGDLLVAEIDAKVGGFGIVPSDCDGAIVSSHYFTFSIDEARLLADLLNLICSSNQMTQHVQAVGSTNYASIRPADVLELPILLPPLDEQRRIVDLIAAVDEAIEAAEGVKSASDQARRGLLGELLSEERAEREGWRRSTLGEVAQTVIGRTPPRDQPHYWTSVLDRPFCTIADMTSECVLPQREGVTEVAEHEGKARRVPAGSLIMSFKLTLGRVGFASVDLFPNEAIAWLRPDSSLVEVRYLAISLSAMDLATLADRAVKGRTLNGSSLRAIPILLPPLDEQRRIVDIVSAADDQASTADSLATTLRTLRSALLADLLSGDHEIPLSYDELLSA
jgi:type I restriction enzyme S subunit